MLNLHFLPGHKDIKKNGGHFSFLFYLCSNLLYFLSTLSKKVHFFLSDGESYLLFKYIWFTYVFSTDKGSFSSFITKAPNLLKNHSPWWPLCRPKPVNIPSSFLKLFGKGVWLIKKCFSQIITFCNIIGSLKEIEFSSFSKSSLYKRLLGNLILMVTEDENRFNGVM